MATTPSPGRRSEHREDRPPPGASPALSRTDYDASRNGAFGNLDEEGRRALGLLAHDLRGPIGVIRGYVEILQEDLADRIDAGDMELLERIERVSDEMLGLVERTLKPATPGPED